jgi:hypothetical protein
VGIIESGYSEKSQKQGFGNFSKHVGIALAFGELFAIIGKSFSCSRGTKGGQPVRRPDLVSRSKQEVFTKKGGGLVEYDGSNQQRGGSA